jgi:hypothetical protein
LLKRVKPELPIIAVGRPGAPHCEGVDYFLESYEPEKLLELLRSLKPQAAAEISRQDKLLAEE